MTAITRPPILTCLDQQRLPTARDGAPSAAWRLGGTIVLAAQRMGAWAGRLLWPHKGLAPEREGRLRGPRLGRGEQRWLALLKRPPVLALVLFGLNAWICRELFAVEYLQYMDSIEGAYVGLARWIQQHPFDLEWFPQWYAGIPFQNSYPPLLHMLVAGFAALTGASPALSHHIVNALMYCLGPAFLFWLGWRLSGDRWAGFAAGLLWSVVPFSGLLIPAIANDMGTPLGLRRLHVLVRYGEGPHVASMTLLPLAVIALDWALKRKRPFPVLVAAFALGAVVLTNWLGALALAAAVLAYLAATMGPRPVRQVAWAAGIGALAYALASPWIPPSTIATIRRNSQTTVGHYPLTAAHAFYAVLIGALLVGIWLLLRRFRAGAGVQFSVIFLLLMGVPTFTWYWADVYVVPQPHRYHVEMEMALALVLGFALAPLLRASPRRVAWVVVACLTVLLVLQFRESRAFARWHIRPVEIRDTIQYQLARWVDEHLGGRRVFATGSVRFWLNTFAGNPQLGGGFDQGITNPQIPALNYAIGFVEDDGERSATWLRAYGVEAVIVSGPESQEPYRDYKDPGKFDGVLPVLWRGEHDAIYQLPSMQNPMARVIPADAVVEELTDHYMTTRPLARLMEAIDEPGVAPATFSWKSAHEALVEAEFPPGQVLSLAITYHPGWHAQVDGRPARILRDALGLMVIDPGTAGPASIRLTYNGGAEMRTAKALRLLALLAGLPWIVFDLRRHWRRNHAGS